MASEISFYMYYKTVYQRLSPFALIPLILRLASNSEQDAITERSGNIEWIEYHCRDRRPLLLPDMSTTLHHARNNVPVRAERLQFVLVGMANLPAYPAEFSHDLIVTKRRGMFRDKDETLYGSIVVTRVHGSLNHSGDCLLHLIHAVSIGDSHCKAVSLHWNLPRLFEKS